jgi:Flp pilus assembly protein TadD
MTSRNCRSTRRRRAKAKAEPESLPIQGDLLREVDHGGADIDRGEVEVIPVVFVSDLADEAAERKTDATAETASDFGETAFSGGAVTADADLPEEIMPDAVLSGGPSADDVPNAAASEEDRLTTAIRMAGEGRLQEATLLFMEILDESPTHPQAQFGLGTLYDDLGRHELAIERFLVASEVDPENAQVRASLGAAYGAVGRFEDADAELKRALRLDPESMEVRAKEGLLAFRKGLYADAEADLRGVCKHDPDHGPAHFYRGEALNRLGRVDEAIQVMERVIELQPHNWRAYHTLGMLFDKNHERERAAEMYRRARELNV